MTLKWGSLGVLAASRAPSSNATAIALFMEKLRIIIEKPYVPWWCFLGWALVSHFFNRAGRGDSLDEIPLT